MSSEDDNIHEVKKYTDEKDIKSKKMSQDKKNDLEKKLKKKDINKVEDIRNRKTSQDKDSDLMEELENEGTYEIKSKDKNTGNGIKTSQGEDNDLKREKKEENIHKVKFKDKDIGKEIKMLQEKDSDAKKALESDTSEVESDNEGVKEYCSDATYLARKMASAERLCQKESIQLYNLNVQLRHKVPPQHEIETRAGSHMPTRKEIEEFERIIPIKRGSYSFEEDKIIASNWKAFCKLHNWDIKKIRPFLQLRIGTLTYMRNIKERRKFVQFLADGLPDRTLYSVYHRFRNLYENNLQGRYKPEEDKMIINHLEHNPSLNGKRKYADLAKVLRRTKTLHLATLSDIKKEKRNPQGKLM